MEMNIEEKVMKALYEMGKSISKGIVYESLTYDLHNVLEKAQLSEDETLPALKILVKKHYIDWDRRAIKITEIGLVYCQSILENKKGKLGFLK
jgi:hypothetical protein